jgi:hypothetical protein
MVDYLSTVASQLGISIWLLAVILIWIAVWKLIALWTAARNKSLVWFIALALINTVGILEILYLFVFSKLHVHKYNSSKKSRKKKRV